MLRRIRHQDKPVTGTRLIREWQGVEHCVTVLDDGYEYGGRPFKSLSHVARTITGTQWNGWTFFGLKNQRRGKPAADKAFPAAGLAGGQLRVRPVSGSVGKAVSVPRQLPLGRPRAKSGASQ